ncbi:MAG TPA: glycoside hydrolase family 97 N-terminal domain-containing protein, partial [Pyrinomonadaceae bacterium]|nr:glycoside hydrolase family 97 N-terminal domain-containing protein [Pyrinomonadaceae bacterium]
MKQVLPILVVLLFGLNAAAQNIQSPNGKLSLSFGLTGDGEPTYQLSLVSKPIVRQSRLGIE